MGFLIDSPTISNIMTSQFDTQVKQSAFQATLADENTYRWIEQRPDGSEIIYKTEPKTTVFSRGIVQFIGWLPIEWML